jgi:hypothetical protein
MAAKLGGTRSKGHCIGRDSRTDVRTVYVREALIYVMLYKEVCQT